VTLVLTGSQCSLVATYDGPEMEETLPTLADKDCKHINIYHDECAFHANNYMQDYWLKDGEQVLKKKEKGWLIMVSCFISPRYSVLRLTNVMKAENDKLPVGEHLEVTDLSMLICLTSKPTGNDYWNAEQMNAQVGSCFLNTMIA
jgi:hypothetical protein